MTRSVDVKDAFTSKAVSIFSPCSLSGKNVQSRCQ